MIEVSAFDSVSAWLATRLLARREELAQLWLDRVNDVLLVSRDHVAPSREVLDHVMILIKDIADYIKQPFSEQVAGQTLALRRAVQLVELRYTRQTPVDQLLHEYQILGDVLDEFCQHELSAAQPPVDAVTAARIVSRVMRRVRFVQRQTLTVFIAKYSDTISRQAEQLREFSRLVSHEVYRPLGVLQVIAKALTVKEGDVDSLRMMDMFNRSVTHLADIAARLDRVARVADPGDASSAEQRVDLSALAASVAAQLQDVAEARDVEISIQQQLPVLHGDLVRVELVLVNLIANGIEYSDPGKPRRIVEVVAVSGQPQPTIEVRDNGIGIPSDKLRQISSELVYRTRRRGGGSITRGLGLGLSVVRECMHDAAGSVGVESVQGIGTTFMLTWPARRGWSKVAEGS